MSTKRVIIYGRVSTADQKHDSQLNEVQEYCLRRFGNAVVPTVITDTASGAKTSRAGLDQMMKLVRRGKVDVVACFKLDRLGQQGDSRCTFCAQDAVGTVFNISRSLKGKQRAA
jgi:DNA invertase Pin-like site-specific DNA recombinase